MRTPISGFVNGPPQLHYLRWAGSDARADTVVFVHGNSANAWWWRFVAEVLGSSMTLIALDLRGHGDSAWMRPPAYSPHDYAQDIANLIDELKIERPLVVGHSMGGVATIAFAERFPTLARGTIAVDVPVTSTPGRNRYLRHLKALPTVTYPDLPAALRSFRLMPNEGAIPPEVVIEIAKKSLMRTQDGEYTLKFDRDSFFGSDGIDVAATISRLTLPLLLIRAGESRIMLADAAARAREENAHVALITLPGAHHHLPLERPDEVALAIQNFARAHPV
jgi:pimeloyl-ACP methyl ester carboxylesterase